MAFVLCTGICRAQVDFTALANDQYNTCKPLARWWWFAATIDKASIADNLYWLKQRGFGGVEIAWVYPLNRMDKDTINYTPRQEWLSPQWTEMVTYAKRCADSLNMSCDFTFGSLWPFGDTKVPAKFAMQRFDNPKYRQKITASWEYPKKGLVIDHLSAKAFDHYAARTGAALLPAMQGSTSALFCDSWEVETKYLSTSDFLRDFKKKYRYDLRQVADSLYCKADNVHRYRYMQLVADKVLHNFYEPFTQKAHSMYGLSRAQVSGAPVDILQAYQAVDIAETEAMLYEPPFARIASSATTLGNRNVVTSETFTCLYGWPKNYFQKEQTADLKLVADALFAHGVNQIIWHGKPYTPAGTDKWRFYASVHLGDSSDMEPELKPFNEYLTRVSQYMRKGNNKFGVAQYLPLEDNWMKGELPLEEQFIWAWGYYELRNLYPAQELKSFNPMWVNAQAIAQAKSTPNGVILGNNAQPLPGIFIDAEYLDEATHKIILAKSLEGIRFYFKHDYFLITNYSDDPQPINVKSLRRKYKNLYDSWAVLDTLSPLITGANNIDYWVREDSTNMYIFLAQPKAKDLKFPIEYGQAFTDSTYEYNTTIGVKFKNKTHNIPLSFKPYQSILLTINSAGEYESININFLPKEPKVILRDKTQRVKWKVYADDKKE